MKNFYCNSLFHFLFLLNKSYQIRNPNHPVLVDLDSLHEEVEL